MKRKRILMLFSSLVSCWLMACLMSSHVMASELSFSVETIIPDNQVDKKKTYFDLASQTGKTQELEIKLNNATDEDVIVEADIGYATTNLNGVVEYGKVAGEKDDTLKYDLSELLLHPNKNNETKIPKKSMVTLKLALTYPKEAFEGLISGGVTFKEKKKEEKKDDSQGMAIENNFAYVVAVLIHGNSEKLSPNLILDKVSPDQVNARNVINGTFKNPVARYLNKLSIDANVTKKGESKILYSSKNENMQMAPNSNFNYPIRLEGKELKAGTYIYKAKAISGTDEWSFSKEFKITNDVAKKLNKQDVSIVKKSYTWWYVAGTILSVLIVVLVALLVKMSRINKLQKLKKKDKRKVNKKRKVKIKN